jgi:hypothetical protein
MCMLDEIDKLMLEIENEQCRGLSKLTLEFGIPVVLDDKLLGNGFYICVSQAMYNQLVKLKLQKLLDSDK